MTHSSHRTPQSTNQSIPRRAEWRLRRASHRDGASSRRRPGGALAREARETNDGRRSVRRRVVRRDAGARDRERMRGDSARAGVERGRARGGARGGARCDEASERAVSEEEPGRGLIHARRRSVMKTY